MTCDASDPLLQRLGHLADLPPDACRSDRVRLRCRAALVEQHPPSGHASRRSLWIVLAPGLAYGTCLGYLFGVFNELIRLYMRR